MLTPDDPVVSVGKLWMSSPGGHLLIQHLARRPVLDRPRSPPILGQSAERSLLRVSQQAPAPTALGQGECQARTVITR